MSRMRAILLTAIIAVFPFRYTLNGLIWIPFDSILLSNYFLLAVIGAAIVFIFYTRTSLTKSHFILFSLYVVLFGYYATSIHWSPMSDYSFSKLQYILLQFPIILAFMTLVVSKSKYRTELFYISTLIFTYICVIVLSIDFVSVGTIRTGVVSRDYISINRILGAGIILSVFCILRYDRLVFRLVPGIFIPLIIYYMMQAGGRGPFVAMLISTGVFIIWLYIFRPIDEININLTWLLMAGGVTTIMIAIFAGGSRTVSRLLILLEGPGSSAMARIDMIKTGLNSASESILIGHGIGSFSSISSYTYPHNIIIEFLVESGSIGLFLFISVLTYSILIIIRVGDKDPLFSGLIISMIIYSLLNSLVSFDISGNIFLFMYISTSLSLIDLESNIT